MTEGSGNMFWDEIMLKSIQKIRRTNSSKFIDPRKIGVNFCVEIHDLQIFDDFLDD